MLDVEIAIECAAWEKALPDIEQLARDVVEAGVEELGEGPLVGAELSLLLCDDLQIHALNATWRQQDKATNVLSFPAGPSRAGAPARLLGDIAVSFETVQREAADEGKSLRDHTAHMIAHGLLHLFGFDHETDADADAMEAHERAILARLGVSDPYRDREAR